MGMCHVGDGEHWWLVQLLNLQLNRLDHQLDLDHEMAVGLSKHLSPRLALLLLLHSNKKLLDQLLFIKNRLLDQRLLNLLTQ
jgi:hypothetical protein